MSVQGRGNYSDPTSFTVESFPAGFIGASAAGAVLMYCGLAVLVVLTLMIEHYCKIRIRCVHMCVATAIMLMLVIFLIHFDQSDNFVECNNCHFFHAGHMKRQSLPVIHLCMAFLWTATLVTL